MKKKVIAIAINLALVLTLGVITTLHTQFAFARVELTPDFWDIQSVNSTGYTVCNPSCHLSNNSQSGNSAVEAAYQLTVNVPSHPFGTSTVGISITTANGYTDQADVPTAGGSSHTFNIPQNQGYSVQVCVVSPTTTVVHIRQLVIICQYHHMYPTSPLPAAPRDVLRYIRNEGMQSLVS